VAARKGGHLAFLLGATGEPPPILAPEARAPAYEPVRRSPFAPLAQKCATTACVRPYGFDSREACGDEYARQAV